MSARAQLEKAKALRAPLVASPDTTCFRWVNGAGDGFPDVTLDGFDHVGVLSLYSALSPAQEVKLADELVSVFELRSLYVKRRPREARTVSQVDPAELAPEHPFRGAPAPELICLENARRFVIQPAQGLSVGLYLDMREVRAWMGRHVEGRTVLNCFAYTCAFGVCARAAGAVRTLNVDLSRKALDWGAVNAALNGQPVDPRDFVAGEVFDWLGRLRKKGERFDVVILDPPSFAKGANGKRGVFSAATDYPALVEAAARVTSSGGLLLACCNLAKLTAARFDTLVRQGAEAAGRRVRKADVLGASALDFPLPPGEAGALKVLACRLD